MKISIQLEKDRFGKDSFERVVDTSFKEFGNTNNETINEKVSKQATVEDFFNLYTELFYDIPEEGALSHQTIIKESSEYVDYNANQEEIEALQLEITSLREQLLEQEQQTLDISNNLSQSINL